MYRDTCAGYKPGYICAIAGRIAIGGRSYRIDDK